MVGKLFVIGSSSWKRAASGWPSRSSSALQVACYWGKSPGRRPSKSTRCVARCARIVLIPCSRKPPENTNPKRQRGTVPILQVPCTCACKWFQANTLIVSAPQALRFRAKWAQQLWPCGERCQKASSQKSIRIAPTHLIVIQVVWLADDDCSVVPASAPISCMRGSDGGGSCDCGLCQALASRGFTELLGIALRKIRRPNLCL